MRHFERILAAVDLGPRGDAVTPGSRRALERAMWIAARTGATVTALHSERPEEYWDAKTESFVMGRGDSTERRRVLEAALEEFGNADVATRLVVRSESPWLEIIHEVLREGIDVVVASKRTDVHSDERKLGTVARKLLRKCPCPVWLEDPRRREDPSVILAATDLTLVGDSVVRLSSAVAHALGAELHVVHAYSLTLEAQLAGGEERQDYEQRVREQALMHIQRVLAPTAMARTAVLHVGLTSPAQAVVEGVAKLRAGLVVMGSVSRGGIPGRLIGNTAERLIDRIDCALFTVKPKDFVCPVSLAPTR